MKRFCFALLVAFSAIATSALAQTYPNRTIRIVVPYAPGGGVSVYANLISGKLSDIVKQTGER
jgi:tripartite-type tricarboxylate transporter receptor subunit TctC